MIYKRYLYNIPLVNFGKKSRCVYIYIYTMCKARCRHCGWPMDMS